MMNAYLKPIGSWLPPPLRGTLDTIHPTAGRAYSPDLHSWLVKITKAQQAGAGPKVGPLQLFLVSSRSVLHRAYGLPMAAPVLGALAGRDGADFYGVQLTRLGAPVPRPDATRYWPGGAAGLISDAAFWSRYVNFGRCALDPHHSDEAVGDRFLFDGRRRRCLWCGEQQQLFKPGWFGPSLWLRSAPGSHA